MEPRDYAAAVCRRWVWVALAGVAGALVAALLAVSAPVTWTASSSVFVGTSRAETPEGLANSALVDQEVVPSVAQLTRSAAVLGPVADELGLDTDAGELAARLDVGLVRDTSVLTISATAATPAEAVRVADGVAAQLQRTAAELYAAGDDGPQLRVESVGAAQEPRFPSSPGLRRTGLLGLLVGLALGTLGVGVAQLVRPRVHDAGAVAALTGGPPLATVRNGPGSRAVRARTADVDRLHVLLDSTAAAGTGGRVLLLSASAGAADALARELHDDGRVLHLTHPALLDPTVPHRIEVTPADVLVVVADAGRTTCSALSRAVAAAADAPAPLLGVVLDGAAAPGVPTGLASAVRGRARLGTSWLGTAGRPAAAGPAPSSRAVALAALFALGLAHPLPAATTTGLVAAVALLPVWAGALPRFRWAVPLSGLAVVALVSGLLLARWSGVDHVVTERHLAETGFAVLTAVALVGVVLWARTFLPLHWIGVAYGFGRVVTGLLRAPGSENAIKFELALPVAILLLALVSGRRSLVPALTALGALGLLYLAGDGRSGFGFAVIAAALVVWQARPTASRGRSRRLAVAGVLGVAGVGGYQAISELLLAGALGSEVQARTATQIAQSGSLLIGGRPEWTATWALMQHQPLGFGLGTVPNAADVAVAKAGMAVAHVPTAESYLEHYMMATGFELHSVVADLWAALGPAGLALGIALLAVLVTGLVDLVSARSAPPLVCFLVPISIWFLAFGPLPSNLPEVAFTVGLVLTARAPRAGADAPPAAAAHTAPTPVPVRG